MFCWSSHVTSVSEPPPFSHSNHENRNAESQKTEETEAVLGDKIEFLLTCCMFDWSEKVRQEKNQLQGSLYLHHRATAAAPNFSNRQSPPPPAAIVVDQPQLGTTAAGPIFFLLLPHLATPLDFEGRRRRPLYTPGNSSPPLLNCVDIFFSFATSNIQ
ncbi:hypothetical protein RHMOL_Rhmol07G0087700 [Rhododendron molle]|uniref:Uncharacterized protein n=1 Tax=Rhododendron molle TaxID=49168 RepID=A0ACC0MYH4_RHOML|nr:hypothetical protein RHMOL_Rhmol07G0087700 [Rhododendron molle]